MITDTKRPAIYAGSGRASKGIWFSIIALALICLALSSLSYADFFIDGVAGKTSVLARRPRKPKAESFTVVPSDDLNRRNERVPVEINRAGRFQGFQAVDHTRRLASDDVAPGVPW